MKYVGANLPFDCIHTPNNRSTYRKTLSCSELYKGVAKWTTPGKQVW